MTFRTPDSQYVTLVAGVANTITFTGEKLYRVSVTPVTIAAPIYFRCDGATAVATAEGTFMVVGLGGVTAETFSETTSVTVSLLSAMAGIVNVVAEEAP